MNCIKTTFLLITFCLAVGLIFIPQQALAHRSGCHTLHTCPSDTGSYICGDLGYPCDGSTSIKDISPSAINVPLLAEAAFLKIFSRKPTDVESIYWKNRFRSDKDSIYKIRRAMAWHKSTGSFGPKATIIDTSGMVRKINAMFRSANMSRNPTRAENQYWISRIIDKPTEQTMKDAMTFHRINDIQH